MEPSHYLGLLGLVKKRSSLLSIGVLVIGISTGWAFLQAVPQIAPDRPGQPPRDAIVLFDGKDTSAWVHRGSGQPCQWVVKEGAMEVRGGDVITKQNFTDFQLHVEFWIPYMPQATGQARGNSGVYLQGLYEIQVLDSYGLQPGKGDCGALYGQKPPDVNACLPPERWQTYDILFHAPRYDAKGRQITKPRVSVLQNGIWIHDNVEVNGPTVASMDRDPRQPGPIMLQDHGSKVRYRNIWIRPLREKDSNVGGSSIR